FEKIEKLYEAAKHLYYIEVSAKDCSLKVPAYMLLQLTKIADKINVSRAMLIRLAIVRYLNLVDVHQEVMQSVSKANTTLVA
ncbi:MAG: hypothetical protein QXU98_06425, partial [Candidatus Parvarchaeota archaeon]